MTTLHTALMLTLQRHRRSYPQTVTITDSFAAFADEWKYVYAELYPHHPTPTDYALHRTLFDVLMGASNQWAAEHRDRETES